MVCPCSCLASKPEEEFDLIGDDDFLSFLNWGVNLIFCTLDYNLKEEVAGCS